MNLGSLVPQDDPSYRLEEALPLLKRLLGSADEQWNDILDLVAIDYFLDPDMLASEFKNREHISPQFYQALNNPDAINAQDRDEAMNSLYDTLRMSRQPWQKSLQEAAAFFSFDPDYLRLEFLEFYGTEIEEYWAWEWGADASCTDAIRTIQSISVSTIKPYVHSDPYRDAWTKLKIMADAARQALDKETQ
jgi:hypothetical protein